MRDTSTKKMPLVLAAVAMELGPLRKQLPLMGRIRCAKPLRLEVRRGPKGPLALALTGMGPQMATRSMQQLFTLVNPSMILSAGLAGGLQPSLTLGDLVWVDRCYALSDDRALTLSEHFYDLELPAIHEKARTGALVSSPRILTAASEKRTIGGWKAPNGSAPVAVEMETYAVLKTIQTNRWRDLPFFSVRAISDTVHENLDIDFSRMINADGEIRLTSTLSYFACHPKATVNLKTLLGHGRLAAKRLAQAISEILEKQPSP